MNLSWLCFVAVILIMIPFVYYGTRSRIQYARRIREASASGAFADMNEPKSKSRFRRLAFLALVGALGMILSLILLVQPWIRISLSPDFFITALIVFGLISSAAGLLMRREIDRRLKRSSDKRDAEQEAS